MRFVYGIIVCIVIFANGVSGSESISLVTLSGRAPGYAGEEIVFYTYTDRITYTEKELVTLTIDDNEEFSASFESSDEVTYMYSRKGRYYIYMFAEPGNDYEIVLPPRNNKSNWESINPYYEGIPTHIAILNHDREELNNLVREFDQAYDPLFGETLIRLTIERDRELLDSIRTRFDEQFGAVENPYFIEYSRYKMALLEIMAQLQSARYISNNHFRQEPVLYDNIAYMELFNQVYNKYFLFFGRTIGGKKIYNDINRKGSFYELRNTLQSDKVLGEERLLELVILKGLHDAFYGSDFSRSGMLTILDSLADITKYPEHEQIAGHIRDKVTRLLAGFEPPDFELMNREGELMSLSDFRGDYVYLNFCTAVSYGCLSEYEILNNLKNKHSDYLRIVTIFIDESYESMQTFLSKNDYDWEFLYYGSQPSLLKEYDVRMFPTYYLIDRDGKLLMSPAPSPAENFENYLLRTMRSRQEFR